MTLSSALLSRAALESGRVCALARPPWGRAPPPGFVCLRLFDLLRERIGTDLELHHLWLLSFASCRS